MRSGLSHFRRASMFRLHRSCAGVVESLESRWLLSTGDEAALFSDTAGTPATFATSRLAPESDTGISSSDGITSDNTPLLQVNVPSATTPRIWAVASIGTGLRYKEIDVVTGQATGVVFDDDWGSYYWAYGSAVGDGKLYTIGAAGSSSPIELRTYDLATMTKIAQVQVATNGSSAVGLAYLNGKLYAADYGGFLVIDPGTGAVLDRKVVFKDGWNWSGTGPSLAGSPGENAIYTVTVDGALTRINPDTGIVIREFANFDPTRKINGLAYAGGRLYASDYDGKLTTIDPATGTRLSTTTLPSSGGFYVAMAGDGVGDPFYRVFDNGLQISSDFEVGQTFQAPQLADGKHMLSVQYFSGSGQIIDTTTLTVRIDTQAPQQPAPAELDASSDTGISSSDRVTADVTPLMNITVATEDASVWVVRATEQGMVFTEHDPKTGQTLSTFTDSSTHTMHWGVGAALGDGVIYVAGMEGELKRLRTYSIATHNLISNVPITVAVSGLAYLNGRLWAAADVKLVELDPVTGAALSSRDVFMPDGSWIGVGGTLAADPVEGVLYSVSWLNKLVKINPDTAAPIAVVDNVSAQSIAGLAFAGGRLLGATWQGQIVAIDRQTGQLTLLTSIPLEPYGIAGMAGEGQQTSLYYRVFSDGLQISGDYESSAQLQLPQLSSGAHVITLKYVDAAGNVSAVGQQLMVRILTTVPPQPTAPTLDPSSNSGNPADTTTNDNTPLLQIPASASASDDLVRIIIQQPNGSQPGNTLQCVYNPVTHQILGQTVISTTPVWNWANGAALGDGLLYVMEGTGTFATSPQGRLLVFNADSGAFLYAASLPSTVRNAAGLGFLDGKLYVAANGYLHRIDPLTGSVLSTVYPYQTPVSGSIVIGSNLTGAADLGRLFAVDWLGQLVSIDPTTGLSTVRPGYDSQTVGLAYANRTLISLSLAGLVRQIDPQTGAILESYQLSSSLGLYSAMAGDEGGEPLYYRVFADGVQVSGDYDIGGSFQMPQLADGQRSITIAYVDAAGNVSAMSTPLTLWIDTVAPARPSVAPTLDASSDTGVSSSDRITADATPLLHVTMGYEGPWAPLQYRVFVDGLESGSGSLWTGAYQMPQLTDGTHLVTIAYVDPAGNLSALSDPLTLRIDTQGPTQRPAAAVVDATSDTGISASDGITSDTTPLLNVTLAPVGTPQLYYRVFCDGAQVSGDYESSAQVQLPQLSSGTHIITLKYVDAAGNVSPVGSPTTLRILTAAPSQPASPTLDPSSNSGDASDDLTNDSTPLIHVPTIESDADGLIRVLGQSYPPGQLMQYIFDPQTGTIVGQTTAGTWQPWDFFQGAAINDGLLYVIGSRGATYGPSVLGVFNADNGAFIYEVPLADTVQYAGGLGYLNGKLYVAGGGLLHTIDPLTGADLSAVTVYQGGTAVYGLSPSLTGAEYLNCLFAKDYEGRLYRIDPGTAQATIIGTGYSFDYLGLAYADGEVIMVNTSDGNVLRLDPQTGALIGTSQFTGLAWVTALAGEGAHTPGSETYYRVFADGVQVSGDYESGSSFEMSQLADGGHSITIAYVDAAGNVSAMSDPLTVRIDTTVPAVQQVIINDGSAQRSMVNQITVTFTEPVVLSTDAIRLTFADGSAIPGTTVTCASSDGQTYVLTFSGEAVSAGSLADGLYKLSIAGASVQDLAANRQAEEFSYGFHRLFGDGAGDGSVSQADLQAFIDALSARYGQQSYVWYFDYDASGRITGTDMSDFIQRFVDSLQA